MPKYVLLSVNRSEVSVLRVAVAPWEVPVLVAVNGDDRCIVEGETPARRDYEYPDARSEYERLETKYGIDNTSGQSFVGMVYGVGSLGIERLAKEIEKASDADSAVALAAEMGPAGDAEVDPTAELFADAPSMAEGVRAIEA